MIQSMATCYTAQLEHAVWLEVLPRHRPPAKAPQELDTRCRRPLRRATHEHAPQIHVPRSRSYTIQNLFDAVLLHETASPPYCLDSNIHTGQGKHLVHMPQVHVHPRPYAAAYFSPR